MATGSDFSGLGKMIAIGVGILGGTRLLERATGRSIWDLLDTWGKAEAARKWNLEQQELQRRIHQTPMIEATHPLTIAEVISAYDFTHPLLVAPEISPLSQPDPATPKIFAEPDSDWRRRIMHLSVILVLGKRGSGKSVLGYRLLELFRYTASPYVIGVPASARSLLPDWIGVAPSLDEVPRQAFALVDEAYLAYHARGSALRESRAMSQAINLSRQREQSIIFVSQEARQVDRNIVSSANVVVFKEPSILQLEFERPELAKIAAAAKTAMDVIARDRRRWSYVHAPEADFVGLMENQLPSFWKPSLTKLFAPVGQPAPSRTPKRSTPQEKAVLAKELRGQGKSYREIADLLGVTSGTVVNYLKGYPYRGR